MPASQTVLAMLRKHNGNQLYHPLCSLLDLAGERDATISEQIMIHKSISKYVEAENKAVEFTGKVTAGIEFNFNMADEEESA